MKLVCAHADTCLPDYWGGHHLPHVAVPVYPSMTMGELRDAIITELDAGAVAGADATPADTYENADWLRAARAAVLRDVKMRDPGARYPFRDLFRDLPESDDDADFFGPHVHAYFVFIDAAAAGAV